MPLFRSFTAFLAVGALIAGESVAQPFPAPVAIRVPAAPAPVAAMGNRYLAYEIHLSSFAPVDIALARIDVFLDRSPAPAASYHGAELASMRLWPSGKPDSTGRLGAGGFDVVFVWLPIGAGAEPRQLRHRITVAAGGGELSVEGATEVRPAADAPVFGPPLRGGPWVVAFGPGHANGHQRTILPIGGRAPVVQRYAIDFYKVDRDGHLFSGDTTKTSDYYAYGAEVLAVADGIIAAAVDTLPENAMPHASRRAVPITLQTIGGNYLMLDIGKGRYVFYAHLQPRSLRVKVGDRVKRGQVVALLGLTGNTPAPHLHVHLGDTTEPIGSEGLPYLFDEFDVVGACEPKPGIWGWIETCSAQTADRRRAEIPIAWKQVTFKQ